MADVGSTAPTSARLVLRRFRPADLDAFVAYRSDPQIARSQSWEAPYRPSQAGQLLAELEATHPGTPGEESTWSKGEWTSDLLYAALRREWSQGR